MLQFWIQLQYFQPFCLGTKSRKIVICEYKIWIHTYNSRHKIFGWWRSWGWQALLGMASPPRHGRCSWGWQALLGMASVPGDGRCSWGRAKKVVKQHGECMECEPILSNDLSVSTDLKFTQNKKNYGTVQMNKGLKICSVNFFEYCSEIKSTFEKIFNNHYENVSIKRIIMEDCMKINTFKFCRKDIKLYFLDNFVWLLIFSTLKITNKRKKCRSNATRKLNIITHQ